jgi:hypothetical protein
VVAKQGRAKVRAWPIRLGCMVRINQACNGANIGYDRFRQFCHVVFLP